MTRRIVVLGLMMTACPAPAEHPALAARPTEAETTAPEAPRATAPSRTALLEEAQFALVSHGFASATGPVERETVGVYASFIAIELGISELLRERGDRRAAASRCAHATSAAQMLEAAGERQARLGGAAGHHRAAHRRLGPDPVGPRRSRTRRRGRAPRAGVP